MLLISNSSLYNMSTITCYVVDVQTNRPVISMPVILKCVSDPSREICFTGQTTHRGQVASWRPGPRRTISSGTVEDFLPAAGSSATAWQIWFDTRNYYSPGKAPLLPLNARFHLRRGEHYNVKLSLGPHTYKISETWTRASVSQALLHVAAGPNCTPERTSAVSQTR